MELSPVAALKGRYKALRRLYLAYLVAAVLALALVFFNQALTLAILAASLVYHFAFLRPRSKGYEREYVHTCVQLTLEQHLQDAVHTAAPTLDAGALRAARLVADNQAGGSILLREGGRGTWKGGGVRLGDATFTHSFPMEGKTHHEFVTGCWVSVELPQDTGLAWRFLDRRVMMPASREKFYRGRPELKLLRDGGPAWTRENDLIFLENGSAQPGNDFMVALRKLTESTKGAVAVCVAGDKLHVFLTNRILGMKVSIREEPRAEQVGADLLPELGPILRMAGQL